MAIVSEDRRDDAAICCLLQPCSQRVRMRLKKAVSLMRTVWLDEMANLGIVVMAMLQRTMKHSVM